MRRVIAIAFAVLLPVATACATTVEKVGGASLTLPNMVGYKSVDRDSAAFRAAARMQDSNHRLVALFVPTKAAFELNAGRAAAYDEWALVLASRPEDEKVTATHVRDIMGREVEKEFGNGMVMRWDERLPVRSNSGEDLAVVFKTLDSHPGRMVAPVGASMSLGTGERGRNFVSYGSLTKVGANEAGVAAKVANFMALMSVKDRFIVLGVYRNVNSPQDVQRAKTSLVGWIKDINMANP